MVLFMQKKKKEINVQIGQQIRNAREKAKMTQEQFAEAVDVSPQYISDLERGVVGVSIPTLKRICSVLGVSSDHILFGGQYNFSIEAITDQCKSLTEEQLAILSEIVGKYVEAIYSERYKKET